MRLKIEARIPSTIEAISPLVDWLMQAIEGSQCVSGEEFGVGMAIREALNNAVVHGNRLDSSKNVQIYCACELGEGVSIVIKDEGQGFDLNAVPDPLSAQNVAAEHGRGILLMKMGTDEISFESGGAEVRMRKRPPAKTEETV